MNAKQISDPSRRVPNTRTEQIIRDAEYATIEYGFVQYVKHQSASHDAL